MKTSSPTSFGLKGSGCNTPLSIAPIAPITRTTRWLVIALVAGLFLNEPQARADGAHFWGHSGGPWSGGPAFSTGGRSFHSGGYSARPRTSIGISFYQGFGPRPSPYYYPAPAYPYYAPYAPVYSSPVYVPPPVVYQQAPVYYGTPVPNRYASQVSVGDEQLMQAQGALRRLGYYKGNIDGLSGPAMRAAVRAYQVDRGLPVTGRLDEDTFQSLGL